jgi:hypothetical protein
MGETQLGGKTVGGRQVLSQAGEEIEVERIYPKLGLIPRGSRIKTAPLHVGPIKNSQNRDS